MAHLLWSYLNSGANERIVELELRVKTLELAIVTIQTYLQRQRDVKEAYDELYNTRTQRT